MEMRVKMKNRSHRYDIIELHQDMITNILNIKCLSMMMVICIKQHLRIYEAEFMEKLSNTETELKKMPC